jgi:AraC family chitin signaling transcriptional activator
MIGHKESIIAVLIHDIKSPLYFLNTVSGLLYKNIERNSLEKNKEIAQEIAFSLNKLYLFTQDFTNWLHASQPGQIQRSEKVDLDKIIGEALAVYNEIIERKHIRMRVTITSKLIYGDESMIKSIIRNLIDNAIKNTPNGGITIMAHCDQRKEECEITIADEGKGMTEEQITAINNYFQSHQEILPFSTLGYGQKVIKDFVQKLGGSVTYRQNNPSGIIATVVLPATLISGSAKVKQSQKCEA